jgi:hypothetical protein
MKRSGNFFMFYSAFSPRKDHCHDKYDDPSHPAGHVNLVQDALRAAAEDIIGVEEQPGADKIADEGGCDNGQQESLYGTERESDFTSFHLFPPFSLYGCH